jgi:tRNA U34 5-methylaminomethyl-2-thiouridine-forming methyltransferase MnmC
MQNKSYEFKLTEDGSKTLHSPLFGEDCHSSYGARTETLIYYIQGCQIQQKINDHQEINILEVGFGFGLGLRTTYEETLNIKGKVQYVTLEMDLDLLKFVKGKKLFEDFEWIETTKEIILKKDHFSAKIIKGDARITLPKVENLKFHAIYQDAFSPKKNPKLWTVEWFRLLKKLSYEDCILSTYSASSSIRKSLIEAGWIVKNGLKFSGKRSSTIAVLQGEQDQEILDHLNRSPVPLIWDNSTDDFIKMR